MSAVADFRVYETAARFAARAGIPREDAVHAVAVARKAGGTGQHVACQYQHAAMRVRQPQPTDDGPRAA